MYSRKQQVFDEVKSVLVSNLQSQEAMREMCDRNIARLEKHNISWLGYFIAFALVIISGVASLSFIANGYNDESFGVVKFLMGVSIAGGVALALHFFKEKQTQEIYKENWSELKQSIEQSMDCGRQSVNKINSEHLSD